MKVFVITRQGTYGEYFSVVSVHSSFEGAQNKLREIAVEHDLLPVISDDYYLDVFGSVYIIKEKKLEE